MRSLPATRDHQRYHRFQGGDRERPHRDAANVRPIPSADHFTRSSAPLQRNQTAGRCGKRYSRGSRPRPERNGRLPQRSRSKWHRPSMDGFAAGTPGALIAMAVARSRRFSRFPRPSRPSSGGGVSIMAATTIVTLLSRRAARRAPGKRLRGCDGRSAHDEREEGCIAVRVDQQQAAGGRASEQGEEDAPEPPSFWSGRRPVGDVADQDDDRRSRSGCKYALYTEPTNRRALHAHRQPPKAE
jgi:hypothetical protein